MRARRFEEAPESFHARHSACWREYSYRILLQPSSYHRDRAWWVPSLPGLGRLRASAEALLGAHDFSAVANQSSDPVDPVCTVTRADWGIWEGGLSFVIRADHFLYRMVRTIVATMIREARPGSAGADGIAALLATRNRALAAAPAPAHGLCLEEVGYDPQWPRVPA
jgi:tRNA pseudouridine38-40 synthase